MIETSRIGSRASGHLFLCLIFIGSAVGCTAVPGGGGGGNANTNANANANGNVNENDNTNGTGGVELPALVGLEPNKPSILPLEVQVAYNDDSIFFHMTFEGDRGDRHDFQHFINGAWQTEGGHRRDAQATLDNDPHRGRTDVTTTIYESRATFMLNDPNGPNAVPDFGRVGCTLTCHDNARAMPLWHSPDGEVHKYLDNDHPGILDLWHWRMARSNLTGYSDDQYVSTVPQGGEEGSRNNDAGTHAVRTNSLDEAGNPAFVLDPSTTAGLFAFPFEALYTTDFYYMMDPAAADIGPLAPDNPVAIPYADAIAAGYTPGDGDAVSGRILQQPTDSAADITSTGTEFIPSDSNPWFGTWVVNLQRSLDTMHPADDVALAEGGIFEIAFAVHVGKVTVRDHYVSFPYTLSLDGGDADIQVVRVQGSGRQAPDFNDTNAFPVTAINLFLPGITSWEFLTNGVTNIDFIDPVTGSAIDQFHGGATALTTQGLGCRDCHTAASSEIFAPQREGGFDAGPMEDLALQRGGVYGPTPLLPELLEESARGRGAE